MSAQNVRSHAVAEHGAPGAAAPETKGCLFSEPPTPPGPTNTRHPSASGFKAQLLHKAALDGHRVNNRHSRHRSAAPGSRLQGRVILECMVSDTLRDCLDCDGSAAGGSGMGFGRGSGEGGRRGVGGEITLGAQG